MNNDTGRNGTTPDKLLAYMVGAGALGVAQFANSGIIALDNVPITAVDPDATVEGDIEAIKLEIFPDSLVATLLAPYSEGELTSNSIIFAPSDHWVKADSGDEKSNPAFFQMGSDVSVTSPLELGQMVNDDQLWLGTLGVIKGGDLPSEDGVYYAGFRLKEPGDSAFESDFLYGWLQYEIGSVTLLSATLETTLNEGIEVGRTVPVPASLALMVAGLAGLTTIRRRRKAAA